LLRQAFLDREMLETQAALGGARLLRQQL